jgi:hypothetical protein
LEYDVLIDQSIVSILQRENTCSYNELYRYVCKKHRKVARESFNFHIKKLQDEKAIQKNDSGARGKKVYYFLTEEAKQKQRLQILEHLAKKDKKVFDNKTKESKRKKLYLLLLFLESMMKPRFLPTEDDLSKFLSMIGTSRKHLTVKEKNYYENDRRIVTRFEPISGIELFKHEKPNEPNEKGDTLVHYVCRLPGVSMPELLHYRDDVSLLEHLDFTKEEAQEAFLALEKEGLIKPITTYEGELRYGVVDLSLGELTTDCMLVCNHIRNKIIFVWTCVRRPNYNEIKWLESFSGRRFTEEARMESYNERHLSSRRKGNQAYRRKAKYIMKEMEREIGEEIEELKQYYAAIFKKYSFPSNELIEMIYPEVLRKGEK